jgi:hypothetical protein
VAGTCGYGEEPSGSKNAGNFLTSCRTSQLLKKDSAPWNKKVMNIYADFTLFFRVLCLVFVNILTSNASASYAFGVREFR